MSGLSRWRARASGLRSPPRTKEDDVRPDINFQLRDLSESDYRASCNGLAPAFAEVPGLLSKVWLADPAGNTYGGVYTWESREAMDDYAKSDLFKMVATHPNFADITSKGFDVLEGPTRVTHGLAAVPA